MGFKKGDIVIVVSDCMDETIGRECVVTSKNDVDIYFVRFIESFKHKKDRNWTKAGRRQMYEEELKLSPKTIFNNLIDEYYDTSKT